MLQMAMGRLTVDQKAKVYIYEKKWNLKDTFKPRPYKIFNEHTVAVINCLNSILVITLCVFVHGVQNSEREY